MFLVDRYDLDGQVVDGISNALDNIYKAFIMCGPQCDRLRIGGQYFEFGERRSFPVGGT